LSARVRIQIAFAVPHSLAFISPQLDSFAKPTDFLQAVISVFEKGLELHPELLSDALTIWVRQYLLVYSFPSRLSCG
jgi:hypothetical protein